MSLEHEVKRLYEEGVARGRCEHEAILANVEADTADQPSPEYGYVEDLARWSDLAEYRGAIEGVREGPYAVARAFDEAQRRDEG